MDLTLSSDWQCFITPEEDAWSDYYFIMSISPISKFPHYIFIYLVQYVLQIFRFLKYAFMQQSIILMAPMKLLGTMY